MKSGKVPVLFSTRYARSDCQLGVVHIGYGAFHRAHQSVYFDDCMDKTADLRWGIAAVNLRPSESEAFHQASLPQDGYLLKTTSPDGETQFRLVRPHIRFADWANDKTGSEALLAEPHVKIISMTVTESGYYLDDKGDLNTAHPVIRDEIEGVAQASIYAYLANGLEQRMRQGGGPVTIMCCDNIRSNGHMLQRNFQAYLQVTGRTELAKWIADNATFPCSMVDRITPRTSQALLDEVAALFPGQNLAPVHGESFSQWVIEDNFATEMPDLAAAGAQIVKEVDPFEETKIRILNGGHTGLCYFGALAGYETFDQVMHDPALAAHFDAFEEQDVLPAITLDLPFDKYEYLAQIKARFGNSAIADALPRICMDGFSKLQIFVRPTLEGCLQQGRVPTATLLSIASWYVFARRVVNGTMAFNYIEPNMASLAPLLAEGAEEQMARSTQLWSDLPDRYDTFVPGLMAAIKEIEEKWPA